MLYAGTYVSNTEYVVYSVFASKYFVCRHVCYMLVGWVDGWMDGWMGGEIASVSLSLCTMLSTASINFFYLGDDNDVFARLTSGAR